MKEDKITKRIKELQKDSKFNFKLTEDIIASVYKIAVEDLTNENKEQVKTNKKEEPVINEKTIDKFCDDVVIETSKKLNKRFGTKGVTFNYEELQKHLFKARQETYREILNYINKKNDLMDVYLYVKEMAKKTQYDEIKII